MTPLERIPDGGGKRFAPGFKETGIGPHSGQRVGFEYLHVAIDDHSRVAYVEALPNEKADTTAGFLKGSGHNETKSSSLTILGYTNIGSAFLSA